MPYQRTYWATLSNTKGGLLIYQIFLLVIIYNFYLWNFILLEFLLCQYKASKSPGFSKTFFLYIDLSLLDLIIIGY